MKNRAHVVRQKFGQSLNNPNVVAQMFWLKNRAGWKDMGIVATSPDSVSTLTIEFVEPPAAATAPGVTIEGTAKSVTTAAAPDDSAKESEPPAANDEPAADAPTFELELVTPEEPAPE